MSRFGVADCSRFTQPYRTLGSLVVSLSNGSLSVLNPNDSHELAITETWHAHDYEPWIAAWNYWDTNVVYSGRKFRTLFLPGPRRLSENSQVAMT